MPATRADNFGADPALGYGAGVRWRSPVGPLRLDLAWARNCASSGCTSASASPSDHARRVDVQTGPPGPRPLAMPRTLGLPMRLDAAEVAVAELQIDGLAPMHAVQGRGVRLWEPGGREYHADAVSFDWDRARISGSVSLGGQPPFTLQARATASARGDGPPWSAQARAAGPLASFDLQGTLSGEPAVRGAAPPALDVQATITPLEAWPLGRLRLLTQGLDLQALYSRAPRTALSGRMDIDSRSFTGPLAATVELDNAVPGRWDQARVPVRRLQARLRSPDNDRSRLHIEQFDLQLAQGADAAGRWQGSGLWSADRLQVDSQLDALQPQRLDGRAAEMTLSGPLSFTVTGLPSPDPGAPAVPAARRTPWSVDLRGTLDGRIVGSPLPVTVAVDAGASAQRIDVRTLRVEAGGARAALAIDARRSGQGPWQVRTSGTLSDFDPVPWWPGPDGSAWRQGPHRLSGSWSLDLTLPRSLDGVPPLALAQGVAGSGLVRIERAQLAGVPLTLQLELGQRPGGGGRPGSLKGELQIAGNRLLAEGQGDPLGDGREDRLQFDLQAGNLAALGPLARLLPDAAPWAPRGGSAQARLTLDGRWPAIRSEGEGQLQDLQAGTLAVRQLQARWRFDTASEQPLLLQAGAQGLVQGAQKLDQLQAELRGTWRQHRLDLTAACRCSHRPRCRPAWACAPRPAPSCAWAPTASGPATGVAAGAGRRARRSWRCCPGAAAGSTPPMPPPGPGSKPATCAPNCASTPRRACRRCRPAPAAAPGRCHHAALGRGAGRPERAARRLRAARRDRALRAGAAAGPRCSRPWAGRATCAWPPASTCAWSEKVDADMCSNAATATCACPEDERQHTLRPERAAPGHGQRARRPLAAGGRLCRPRAGRSLGAAEPAHTPGALARCRHAHRRARRACRQPRHLGRLAAAGLAAHGELRTSATVGGRVGAPDYAGEVRGSQRSACATCCRAWTCATARCCCGWKAPTRDRALHAARRRRHGEHHRRRHIGAGRRPG
jgi:hypothetical protein